MFEFLKQSHYRMIAFILAASLSLICFACVQREPVINSQDESIKESPSINRPTEAPSASLPPTDTPSPQPTQTPESISPSPTPSAQPFSIGESGSIGGMFFRVLGTHLDEATMREVGDIWHPKEGHYFFFVDLEVRNDRMVTNLLSALIAFRIQDQSGQTWGITLGDEENSLLDLTLLPGQSVEGVAAFELPNDVRDNLTLIIKPDLISTSMLCFDLSSTMAAQAIASESNSPIPVELPSSTEPLQIGDTVYSKSWAFRVLDTSFDALGRSYFAPPEGYVFYIVKLKAENLASHPQDITSLLVFSLRDADGNSYGVTVNPTIADSLDGEVAANGSLEGEITFIVPESYSGNYVLDIHPELLMQENISIELDDSY